MKCEWQDCANEGTNVVIRASTPKEQEELTTYEGAVASIPKYFKKTVCNECLQKAKQDFPLTEDEAVF